MPNNIETMYPGLYKGFVRDVEDPKQLGRARVYLPQVFGEADVASKWSNWAKPCNPTNADFRVPPVGSPVWIMFEMANPRFPVVMGVFHSSDDVPKAAKGEADGTDTEKGSTTSPLGMVVPPTTRATDYPNNSVWRTPNGIQLEVDDSAGSERVQIWHPSGTFVEMYQDGTVSEVSLGKSDFDKGDRQEYTGGDKVEEVTGNKTERVVGVREVSSAAPPFLCKLTVNGTTLTLTVIGLDVNIAATGSLSLNGRPVLPVGGPI